MLKASPGPHSKSATTVSLVLFQVGGRRLAVKAGEIGGIWTWTTPTVVPSVTPYLSSVLRRGSEVLPVFDLGARLGAPSEGPDRFCLIAKHPDGPVAMCIDGPLPALHLIDPGLLQAPPATDTDIDAIWPLHGESIPVYALGRIVN